MFNPAKNLLTSSSVHCQGKPLIRTIVFSSILSSTELDEKEKVFKSKFQSVAFNDLKKIEKKIYGL